MCNANCGFNAINATIPHDPQTTNSVSNGILKQPGVIEMGQHEVFQEMHASERLGKRLGVDVAAKSREVFNNGMPSLEAISQNSHVLARVSTHATQGRVLPSWTHRCRPATQVQKTPAKKITGKKRELGGSGDYVESISKCRPIS